MRKFVSLVAVLMVLLVCQSALFAAPAPLENPGTPVWRVDAKNVSTMPGNFRTSFDPFKEKSLKSFKGELPSRDGMFALKISGSAMFSANQFDKLIAEIRTLHEGPVVIMDLRQESHGFVNGIAVSSYVDRNWINVGKSVAQVEKDEKAWLRNSLKAPIEISVLDDDKKASETQRITVETALTEKEFVTSRKIGYFRIQATDHASFTDEQVDDFVKFYNKELPQDAWLHFHCFAGEGRTTQLMVMYDILRNGKNVSFQDIVSRQLLIGGNDAMKVTASKAKDAYKVPLYKEKAQMLRDFYQYVTTNPDNLPVSFSKWKKAQKAGGKSSADKPAKVKK